MASSGVFDLPLVRRFLKKCKKTYNDSGGRFFAAALVDDITIDFCASLHYEDLRTIHPDLVPAIKKHFTSGLAALGLPTPPLLLRLQRDGIVFTPAGKPSREQLGRSWRQQSKTLVKLTENLKEQRVPFVCFQVGHNAEMIEVAHPAGSLFSSVPWSAMRSSSCLLTLGSQLDHARPSAAQRPPAYGDAGAGTAKRLRYDGADAAQPTPSAGLPLLDAPGGESWFLARIAGDPTRCKPVPLYDEDGVKTWAMHDVCTGTGTSAEFYVSDVHVLVSGGWL
jgi:hypothetical protein